MVSPDGIDGPQCLNYSTPCKTSGYPIEQGFTAICLHGTYYNVSEHVTERTDINMVCKDCEIINSEFTFSCISEKICKISIVHVTIKYSTIRLGNVQVTFSNVTLEQSLIEDLINDTGNKQIQLYDSNLICFEQNNCGIHLENITAAKVVFKRSHLSNFRIECSISQLILVFYQTDIIMPSIKINIKSFEYLKILAMIQFERVRVLKTRDLFTDMTKKEVPPKVKRNVEQKSLENSIVLDITNPYIILKESHFAEVHMEIQSKRQHFEPVSFLLLFERSSFINSHYVGNGGGLKIISQVQNSKVIMSDCLFSNNSAVKGLGSLKGRGGGLYVDADSLKLEMTGCRFLANKASDSGLALYTTNGVEVSLTNCTFQYSVDPLDPIQQSLLHVSGKVSKFDGLVQISNPRPESYVGPINLFYIGLGEHFNTTTQCPMWYNHVIEYTTGISDSHVIPDASYTCSPCSDDYYTVAVVDFTLSYDSKENISLTEKLNENLGPASCDKCEYGAVCTGNNVVPRPNYWGYWHEGKLAFQQCPAGYCCSGSDTSTRNVEEYCMGNRTGTLCGACQEGFSVSIQTGACTPDSQCGGDQWFWIVAFFSAMAYALWYTLKDDIFSLFFGSIEFVRGIFKRSKVNESPRGLQSSNRELQSISSFHNSDQVLSNNADDNIDDIDNKMAIKETGDQDDVDKGYFGIVTYYVQMAAVIMIQIEFNDVDESESFLDKIVKNIELFLNLELTQMSFDACPITGLTTLGKNLYNIGFLLGIYISWAGVFVVVIMVAKIVRKMKMARKLESFELKLIQGMIEIIKYTYGGFSGIIFMSLVCAQIGKKYVWWYDGTNVCLENWQIVITIFAVVYAIPFPLALALGLKMLKQNKLSPATFILSCLFPLVAICIMLISICSNKSFDSPDKPVLSEKSEAIISVLQGPYRDDEKDWTIYWEAMVSIRRLLITGMTLVSYASIRMIIIMALNLIFLVQHDYMKPFEARNSNDVEALSLALLVVTSVTNLLKALLTDSGIVPSGPTVPFFKSLEVCEKTFVLLIIAYIFLIEVRLWTAKKKEKPKQNSA